jgi:hypothetical protein
MSDHRRRGAMDAEDVDRPDPEHTEFSVAALTCSADRTVFTEDDNDDAWIATDTTVDVTR